ncbi:MAG: alpha/beta fold hydrolase [Polyangiaceae bacterium]
MERHIRTVGDCDISWLEVGPRGVESAGTPPLVLLHGLSDSNHTWDLVAPTLGRTRRVLMPDLPGHGRSSRPDATYSIRWYARTIAAWLRATGLREIDLVGHSLGGGVAQRLLIELHRLGVMGETELPHVRRLGLVASGGLGREVAWLLRLAAATGAVERIGQPFMDRGTRLGMRILGGEFKKPDRATLGRLNDRAGTARALSRTLSASVGLGGQRPHFLDHAHELPKLPPIAVFWGDRDRVIPVSHVKDASTFLEGITVRRFERAGHYPHRESVAQFVPALLHFLDRPQAHPSIKPKTRPRGLREMVSAFLKAPARISSPGLLLPKAASAR